MLDKAKTLRSYRLRCRDGEIGSVKEFYFDDQYWTIRYLVADTVSAEGAAYRRPRRPFRTAYPVANLQR